MREESKEQGSCFLVSLKSKKKMAVWANPVSDAPLISLIIAELIDWQFISDIAKANWRITHVRTLLPAPAVDTQVH